MNTWVPWIEIVPYDQSHGKLRMLYDRVTGPGNNVDNIMLVHSLRPHSMEGHMALYKSVLHHTGNTLPKWLLELVGVYVSLLNRCAYCVEHHYGGLKRLLNDDGRAAALRATLESDDLGGLDPREQAMLAYARALTLTPAETTAGHVHAMRGAGLSDGEILEVNQVTAYFAYANRTVLGLGVTTDGDILGLSPNSGDGDDWTHR
ncbi:peroxidase-related enzyme [Deinococcus sp.]|uniref:carboxymuconolactone decarboxylase family protein n=1 Tax=Deinococcus sp. TaxID=47478 RepID=UPI002869CC13|nr:peroxidase-related enzyme [Deinococcus sp.]